MNLGGLTLSNPAALWGLLALPALVAIHFLQQRARRVETSTRFLIDALAPESAGGRTWDRFIGSRSFWLQLLTVLLLAWVWAGPRWPRADSRQTVVIVLDDAIAMQAVVEEARREALALMADEEAKGSATEWVIMGSNPRAPALYRGAVSARAEQALRDWRPALGTHAYEEALGAARAQAGLGGVCWFVTDSEAKVPPDQAAVGVGRPLANLGFAGGAVERAEDGSLRWRAVVRNSSSEAQRRAWWLEGKAGASERRVVELPPDGVVELAGAWPADAERATLRLEADDFRADDGLPLIRPKWKRLVVRVETEGEAGDFFRRLLTSIDGVDTQAKEGASQALGLRVVEEAASAVATPPGAAVVVLAPTRSATGQGLLRASVVAERHPLVEGLNWQALLGPGPAGLEMNEEDLGLLWQAERPLAWLRTGPAARRQLVLNLDWAASNVGRLPATVLMVRRHVEATRDAQPGVYAANFDAGGRVPLAEADLAAEGAGGGGVGQWAVIVEGGGRRLIPSSELAVLRAPAEAAFFTVQRGGEILVQGATQFADVRQGDFRAASRFRRETPAGEVAAARARNTQDDPLGPMWLALAGAALLASWAPDAGGARATAKPKGGER